jgi:hypothetical protein
MRLTKTILYLCIAEYRNLQREQSINSPGITANSSSIPCIIRTLDIVVYARLSELVVKHEVYRGVYGYEAHFKTNATLAD